MSPFWFLVIGLGTAWFIASGRATAVYKVLLLPTANIYQKDGTQKDSHGCPPGYIFDGTVCLQATLPPSSGEH